MFYVDFEIHCARNIKGLDALDLRRRLGLPDATELLLSPLGSRDWLEVDEIYARKRFPRNQNRVRLCIPIWELIPGDIIVDHQSGNQGSLVSSKCLSHHLNCQLHSEDS